jgi:hypothetical protein
MEKRVTGAIGLCAGRQSRPPFSRSQYSLSLFFSKQSCDEVSGRSESLLGRNRSGFGIDKAIFGRFWL